jgi:hypothetical protein
MESGGVIFLRWIDYVDLLRQYREGSYLDNTFNNVKFQIQVDDLIKEKYGANPTGNRFAIRSSNGCEVIVHTTNVHGFNGTLTVENAPLCGYCRTNLGIVCVPDSSGTVRKPFPMINRRDIEVTIEKHFDPAKGKTVCSLNKKRVYSGDVLCCDGECAVTLAMTPEFKGTNNEMYTREVYRYMHPDKPALKRAKPYRFLKHNGGDMTYAEYKRESHSEFRELSGAVIAPSKRFIIAI